MIGMSLIMKNNFIKEITLHCLGEITFSYTRGKNLTFLSFEKVFIFFLFQKYSFNKVIILLFIQPICSKYTLVGLNTILVFRITILHYYDFMLFWRPYYNYFFHVFWKPYYDYLVNLINLVRSNKIKIHLVNLVKSNKKKIHLLEKLLCYYKKNYC